MRDFTQKIRAIDISRDDLRTLNDRFTETMTGGKKALFQQRNRLYVKTRISNNGIPIEEVVENYISGSRKGVEDIFRNSQGEIVWPTAFKAEQEFDFDKFKSFNVKAIDSGNQKRKFDTELKYIANFLEKHWNKGNKFEIEMESVLYSCKSCQRYLSALYDYAGANNKVVNIKFIANKQIESTIDVIDKI